MGAVRQAQPGKGGDRIGFGREQGSGGFAEPGRKPAVGQLAPDAVQQGGKCRFIAQDRAGQQTQSGAGLAAVNIFFCFFQEVVVIPQKGSFRGESGNGVIIAQIGRCGKWRCRKFRSV
jgi:hypothetical protein